MGKQQIAQRTSGSCYGRPGILFNEKIGGDNGDDEEKKQLVMRKRQQDSARNRDSLAAFEA